MLVPDSRYSCLNASTFMLLVALLLSLSTVACVCAVYAVREPQTIDSTHGWCARCAGVEAPAKAHRDGEP